MVQVIPWMREVSSSSVARQKIRQVLTTSPALSLCALPGDKGIRLGESGTMKQSKWLSVGLSVLVLLMASACCEVRYSNPPPTFRDSDLVGIWEVRYSGQRVDTLIVQADGTFKQIYHEDTEEGYIYETPWNEWWVERFSDARARVHLQGARLYWEGIGIAELEGMSGDPCPEELPDCHWDEEPWSFYDPIADESLSMVGELVLNVQSDASGNLVLLHMLLSRDQGFVSLTGEAVGFSRVETEPPLQTPQSP